MYLHKIKLHNFKCYEDISVDFHPRLTVLAGINGSGKTTVLDAAAIALSTMFQPLTGTRSIGIRKEDARLVPFEIGSAREAVSQYPVEISADGSIDGQEVHWKRSLNTAKSSTTIKDAKEVIDIAKEALQRLQNGDLTLSLPILAYYGTGRLWDYHREKRDSVFKTNSRLNGYVDSLDGTVNVKLMMDWFRKVTMMKFQQKEIGLDAIIPELDAVTKAMEICYQKIAQVPHCTIQYRLSSNELMLSYRTKDNAMMQIPVSQLSEGYKTTISLVADIAYRMAVLNPQLQENICSETSGIVLIDEVDQHLHPSWQQEILDDLTTIFPRVQFIVTTHAPAVINTFTKEHLRLLKDGMCLKQGNETYGKDVNSVLKEIMGTEDRPAKISQLFQQFYDLLAKGEPDQAEKILDHLTELRDYHDPELVRCKTRLRLERL